MLRSFFKDYGERLVGLMSGSVGLLLAIIGTGGEMSNQARSFWWASFVCGWFAAFLLYREVKSKLNAVTRVPTDVQRRVVRERVAALPSDRHRTALRQLVIERRMGADDAFKRFPHVEMLEICNSTPFLEQTAFPIQVWSIHPDRLPALREFFAIPPDGAPEGAFLPRLILWLGCWSEGFRRVATAAWEAMREEKERCRKH